MRKSFPMLLTCRNTEHASRLSSTHEEKYWGSTWAQTQKLQIRIGPVTASGKHFLCINISACHLDLCTAAKNKHFISWVWLIQVLARCRTRSEKCIHLWEVAGRWGAVAQGVLGWQRVVEGRPPHMAGVHRIDADVKLFAQTQLKIISAACELQRTKAQK